MTFLVAGAGSPGSGLALTLSHIRQVEIGLPTNSVRIAGLDSCSGPSPEPGSTNLLHGVRGGGRPPFAANPAAMAVAEARVPRMGTPQSTAAHEPGSPSRPTAVQATLPYFASPTTRTAV